MLGLMQQQSLLISSLIDFAEKHHGDSEIVSRRVEGDIHRYAWADVARRSRQVANALDADAARGDLAAHVFFLAVHVAANARASERANSSAHGSIAAIIAASKNPTNTTHDRADRGAAAGIATD